MKLTSMNYNGHLSKRDAKQYVQKILAYRLSESRVFYGYILPLVAGNLNDRLVMMQHHESVPQLKRIS